MFKKFTACAILIGAMATSANAATFDFAADAQSFFAANTGITKYEGTFDQVYGLSAVDIDGRAAAAGTIGGNTKGGITVSASASNPNSQFADPFMDSISGGKVAGLGVCSSGFRASGKSKCSTNVGPNQSDDNLKSPEQLTLMFNSIVSILGLQIRDAGHNLISNTVGALWINGSLFNTGANGEVILRGLGNDSTFDFTSNGTAPGKEIYLSVLNVQAVPVPASLPLLAGGMGLLAWGARRRKTKAA
jgi:hypothetical protein